MNDKAYEANINNLYCQMISKFKEYAREESEVRKMNGEDVFIFNYDFRGIKYIVHENDECNAVFEALDCIKDKIHKMADHRESFSFDTKEWFVIKVGRIFQRLEIKAIPWIDIENISEVPF